MGKAKVGTFKHLFEFYRKRARDKEKLAMKVRKKGDEQQAQRLLGEISGIYGVLGGVEVVLRTQAYQLSQYTNNQSEIPEYVQFN